MTRKSKEFTVKHFTKDTDEFVACRLAYVIAGQIVSYYKEHFYGKDLLEDNVFEELEHLMIKSTNKIHEYVKSADPKDKYDNRFFEYCLLGLSAAYNEVFCDCTKENENKEDLKFKKADEFFDNIISKIL